MHHAVITQGGNDLGHMARHMIQIMDRLLKSGFSPSTRAPDWTPAVDICELVDRYEVIVELAGVCRDDIEVYTQDCQLTVTGWRSDPSSHEKCRLHQMEIEQGRFRRCIHMPDDADDGAVTARCREGLLRIQMPKRRPQG
ncbi:MAG: Hsp20/alpha crystallin family protein [Phycisphaerae bacterium]